MKTCTVCKKNKESSQYYKDKRGRQGLYAKCKPCHNAVAADYDSRNPDQVVARQKKYRVERKGRVNAKNSNRRARKLQATPSWSDLDIIKSFYEGCPEGYHVDHIIPLNNNRVCGLHVIENLQYLLAEDNIKKGNHFAYL